MRDTTRAWISPRSMTSRRSVIMNRKRASIRSSVRGLLGVLVEAAIEEVGEGVRVAGHDRSPISFMSINL